MSDWAAQLPEPVCSAVINRSQQYGSPYVLEGFHPHVTVGFDPSYGPANFGKAMEVRTPSFAGP